MTEEERLRLRSAAHALSQAAVAMKVALLHLDGPVHKDDLRILSVAKRDADGAAWALRKVNSP